MVGEHIRALKRGRWNHAIDCGDETVIHLASDDASFRSVRRSYRPDFILGAEAVEVVTHRERTFPASEVVARAYSRISDPGLAAMFRDSEAFADWCVTGRLGAPPQSRAVPTPALASSPSPGETREAPAPAPGAKPQAKAKGAARARPARAGTKRRSTGKASARRPPAKKARKPAKGPSRKPAKKAARTLPEKAARKLARKAPPKPAAGGARRRPGARRPS